MAWMMEEDMTFLFFWVACCAYAGAVSEIQDSFGFVYPSSNTKINFSLETWVMTMGIFFSLNVYREMFQSPPLVYIRNYLVWYF